jgi:hypothetical protein
MRFISAMQGWLKTYKNQFMYYITRLKDRYHMIISVDSEKVLPLRIEGNLT